MTSLFESIILAETQKAAHKEVEYSITVINKIYNEWKKITRRINAVDLITTSANKIAGINPEVIDHLHAPAKEKLAVILMRCMDLPPWRPVTSKEKIYKKLFPLIQKMERVNPNTGTGAALREIIMTRLSAAISHQDTTASVFVAYEPVIPAKYLKYLHGDKLPEKTYRMAALALPADFESLVDILTINHEKAKSKLNNKVADKA
jgi:hypothetical protein